MPWHPKPRTQVWAQVGVLLTLFALAAFAAVSAVQSNDTASQAADVGSQACDTQIANYASSKDFRVAIRQSFREQANLDDKTAQVFNDLANLAKTPNPATQKILDLALAYARASAHLQGFRDRILLPTPPTCKTT